MSETQVLYANDLAVCDNKEEIEMVLSHTGYSIMPGWNPSVVVTLSHKKAAELCDKLAAVLREADPEKPAETRQEELPLTSTGDFGAEHEIHDTAGAGWRERFGVQL